MPNEQLSAEMGTYWLPKGTKVICNGVEIILDDDSNSVLVRDVDWPELQRAFFPRDEWDEDFEDHRT